MIQVRTSHLLHSGAFRCRYKWLVCALVALFTPGALALADAQVVEGDTYRAYSLPTSIGAANLDADNCITFVDYQQWLQLYRGFVPERSSNRYLFTGRRLDFDVRDVDGSVTGQPGRPLLTLYHYCARTYDPWHGRFLQRDPQLYLDSHTLYQYVLDNPLAQVDPTGESLLLDLLYSTYLRAGLRVRTAAISLTALGYFRAIADAISFRNQMLTGLVNAASRMGQRGIHVLLRADQVMGGTAGRVFTASTYRDAYIWLRGGIQQGYNVHYILPQQFAKCFQDKGISIHVPLWLQEIEAGAHARLSAAYNAAWRVWISKNQDATVNEVFDQARKLMLEIFGTAAPF